MIDFYKRSLCVVMFCLWLTPIHAQWAYNPAVNNPLCTAQGNQKYANSIPDGKGGTIYAWEDERLSTRLIYAQRIDSLGKPLWGTDGVGVAASSIIEFNPAMISDGQGGALITFTVGNTNNNEVYIQRLDSLGKKKWGSSGIMLSSSTIEDDSQVMCSDGKGGAFVVWINYKVGQHTTFDDLWGQYVDSSGVTKWSMGGIIISKETGAQILPTVCEGPGGSVFVSWQDLKKKASQQDIYVQRIRPNGSFVLGTKGVKVSTASVEAFPILRTDGADGAFLVWTHQSDIGNGTVNAMRIDSSANAIWGISAVCTSVDNTVAPEMKYIGNNSAIVAWVDQRADSSMRSDIYAGKLGPSGLLWQAEGVPVCTAKNFQNSPAVDGDGAGGGYFVWIDQRSGTDFPSSDIYGQRLNPDGTAAWTIDGVPVCIAAQGQDRPTVTGIPNSGMVAAWEDYRVSLSNVNLYCQKIHQNGSLPPTPPPVLVKSAKVMAFPSVKVGVRKDTTFTFSNTGGDTLRIYSIISSNPAFTQTMLMKNIAPGASNIKDTLRFKPTVTGYTDGYLLINSNAAGSPDTIYYNGTGTGASALSLSTKNVTFGKVLLGSTKDQLLTSTNSGTDTLRITGCTSNNPSFKTTQIVSTILPNKSQIDTLRFSPSQLGPVSGLIFINSNTPGAKDTIKVSGIGYGIPATQLDAKILAFSDVEVGKKKSEGFTITNSGNDTLTVTGITSDNAAFTVKDYQQILLPNQSLTDSVVFAPATTGGAQGKIIIRSNATKSSDTIQTSGNGTPTLGVENTPFVTAEFEIAQNYPNPFSNETIIPLTLKQHGLVRLSIFSALGEEIETLVSSTLSAGSYNFRWTPREARSGAYYYRLMFNRVTVVRPLMIVR
jgi:hypothetical protein